MIALHLLFTANPALSFLGVRCCLKPFHAEHAVLMALHFSACHPAAHRHAIRFDNENAALAIASGISRFTDQIRYYAQLKWQRYMNSEMPMWLSGRRIYHSASFRHAFLARLSTHPRKSPQPHDIRFQAR